jgi:DNA-binding NarL/FixJ family response regulator
MAAGRPNKEIAQVLGIRPATVRNHVQSLLGKLAVRSRLEAVSIAFRRGWVREPAARDPEGYG